MTAHTIRMSGAQIVIHLLERQKISTIAGIPGGANLPLYDALSRSRSIRHVLARHEQGAGFIAQGMARVTGAPAVCFATSGPGATNILTAIADAKLDSIPVVCITGQTPRPLIGTDSFQEVDVYGMSIPITKHNFMARSAGELLEIIPEAFRIASSGRPGPVLIDIPKDVQTEEATFDAWPEPGRPDAPPEPDGSAVARAASFINASRRPILYIGGGVIQAEASALAVALAEKASIPTAMSLMGLGAVPSAHPLALGMLGMHAARATNLALEECDLLIAAGVRFDDRATGKVEAFCPQAKIVHIDIDPAEIDKLKTPHAAIVGDAGRVFEALLPQVERNPRRDWLTRVGKLQEEHPFARNGADDLGSPCGIITRTAELLDEDAVIVTDVGQHQMWTAQHYPFRRPRRWLTSGGLGTMGFGLPSAIGAALARPQSQVVCFSGDGSIMMNIQELATAVEQNANVTVIVLNNCALGLVRQQQSLFYGNRIYASVYPSQVDFVKIAEGFGVKAYDLARASDPSAMLEQALKGPGPRLIHARIDANEQVLPMTPPGAANKDMIEGESHVRHFRACA